MSEFRSRIVVEVPGGWSPFKESLQLIAPRWQANVIVSSEEIGPIRTTQEYVAAHEHSLRSQIEGYREISIGPAAVFGGQAVLRHFDWQPPDGVAVTQLQAYLVDGARGYTATATAPTTQFAAVEDTLRTILGSVRLA